MWGTAADSVQRIADSKRRAKDEQPASLNRAQDERKPGARRAKTKRGRAKADLVVLLDQVGEGFGVLAGSAVFARRAGYNALRFGLADTFAGVGFYGLDGGEGLLFGAFLQHF
jgi:hypothetical protein